MAKGKGILKVSRTNKGKIFVEVDRLNNRPPMLLSYVVFPDTTYDGKACEYETDDKGIFLNIKVDGREVWSRRAATAPTLQKTQATDGASKFRDSFSLCHTCLPKDIREGLNIADIDNFNLKLHKAARLEQWKDKYKFIFFKNDQRQHEYFEIRANYGHLNDRFQELCQRQTYMAERLFPSGSRKIMLRPQWRFVLGLGGESVYETSMALHHLYGIPYLPASSIKGVLRSWVISQIFAQPEQLSADEEDFPLVNAEFRAITSSKLFCKIFGCPEESEQIIIEAGRKTNRKNKKTSALGGASQGIVTFFDGLPTTAPVVKTDVMNPHYKDWYKDIGYSAPTDTQRTNPIHFLTVSNEKDLRFQTFIGIEGDTTKLKDIDPAYHLFLLDGLNGDSSLADLVKVWLEKSLSEFGIGSKTSVGYGRMA